MEIKEIFRDVLSVIIIVITFLIVYNVLGFLSLNLERVNVIVLAVLVLITAKYTKATTQIVEETQKDRNMIYLGERIEKFYSPLINNNIFWNSDPETLARLWNVAPRSESADSKSAKDFLESYRKYSYLATKDLELYLSKFKVFLNSTMDKEEFEIFKKNFKEALHKDYEKLMKELEKLTS